MKQIISSRLTGTLAAIAVSVAASSITTLQAAPLTYDDFSTYTVGVNIATANLNGGNPNGWGGAWAAGASGQTEDFLNNIRSSPQISYPNYVPSGAGNFANVAAGYGGPNFNYIQRTVDVAGAFSAYSDGTRVGLNGTTLWGSFLYNNVNNFEFWLQGAGNTVIAGGGGSTTLTSGNNHLFLFRLSFGAANSDVMSIWKDPDLTTWTPSSTVSAQQGGDLSFQTLVFVAGASTYEGGFDNVALGAQFSDVIPVPEPSTIAFLAFSGLAILAYPARARRRNA